VAWRLEKEPPGFFKGGTKTARRRATANPVRWHAEGRQALQSGVIEIALRYASDAYRVVTAVQLGRRIYVLHAFQKKSKKGIETPKRDADLIKKRYAEARELAHEYEKTKIN
jgi:phage-related protein